MVPARHIESKIALLDCGSRGSEAWQWSNQDGDPLRICARWRAVVHLAFEKLTTMYCLPRARESMEMSKEAPIYKESEPRVRVAPVGNGLWVLEEARWPNRSPLNRSL